MTEMKEYFENKHRENLKKLETKKIESEELTKDFEEMRRQIEEDAGQGEY
jgi:hypothetical protein